MSNKMVIKSTKSLIKVESNGPRVERGDFLSPAARMRKSTIAIRKENIYEFIQNMYQFIQTTCTGIYLTG